MKSETGKEKWQINENVTKQFAGKWRKILIRFCMKI